MACQTTGTFSTGTYPLFSDAWTCSVPCCNGMVRLDRRVRQIMNSIERATKTHLLGAVGGFAVDIAHKIGEASMPELLADRHVLADVVPVVIYHAQQQRPKVGAERLAVD